MIKKLLFLSWAIITSSSCMQQQSTTISLATISGGHLCTMQIVPTTTVADVKAYIFDSEGLSTHRQNLHPFCPSRLSWLGIGNTYD